MAKVLVVSGHPRLDDDSVANKTILQELGKLMPDAQVDRLDRLYPDFKIDVAAEQGKLVSADVIVLQYPMWWYSYPSLMHKWMEDVFVHGFSHGSTGTALQGKKLVASLTTGAPEQVYASGAMDAYLAPLKATCDLTGMEFAGSVITYGVSYLSRTDEKARKAIEEKACDHAKRLVRLVQGL